MYGTANSVAVEDVDNLASVAVDMYFDPKFHIHERGDVTEAELDLQGLTLYVCINQENGEVWAGPEPGIDLDRECSLNINDEHGWAFR